MRSPGVLAQTSGQNATPMPFALALLILQKQHLPLFCRAYFLVHVTLPQRHFSNAFANRFVSKALQQKEIMPKCVDIGVNEMTSVKASMSSKKITGTKAKATAAHSMCQAKKRHGHGILALFQQKDLSSRCNLGI
jgi:hypothetical protein